MTPLSEILDALTKLAAIQMRFGLIAAEIASLRTGRINASEQPSEKTCRHNDSAYVEGTLCADAVRAMLEISNILMDMVVNSKRCGPKRPTR
jgi:hypothetical protein